MFEYCEVAEGSRVDSMKGVIYGVKICGLRSRNVGRTIGLTVEQWGPAADRVYKYSHRALESAIPKYEGSVVRWGHPPTRINESGVRVVLESSRGRNEVVGGLKDVAMRHDGLYGDLHLSALSPRRSSILETAQRAPSSLALSHNAHGLPVLGDDGHAVIDEIQEVYSVDLVTEKPGTTNGLFESAADDGGECQAALNGKEFIAALKRRTA